MDFLQHPATRDAGVDQRRRHRRADVDDRHLRSGAEPGLSRNRQSRPPCSMVRRAQATTDGSAASSRSIPTPASWCGGSRRRRTIPTTGMRRKFPCWWTAPCGHAAQDVDAGVAERLLLRARSDEREEPVDQAVCRGQLGEGDRREGRPDSRPGQEPARDGRLVAPNEGGGTNYRSPSFDPKTGLFIVSAQDAYGIYFFKPEHGAYGWAGADYGDLRARGCCGRSTTRPARSGGNTRSAAKAAPAC